MGRKKIKYDYVCIECFHSHGQHLCKFIGTKGGVCIRKELPKLNFNSQRTGLGHQHGCRFIVLGHQYGRRDVIWKHSIEASLKRSWEASISARCNLMRAMANKSFKERGRLTGWNENWEQCSFCSALRHEKYLTCYIDSRFFLPTALLGCRPARCNNNNNNYYCYYYYEGKEWWWWIYANLKHVTYSESNKKLIKADLTRSIFVNIRKQLFNLLH